MEMVNQSGSIISRDTELDGDLSFTESMSINGKMQGQINSDKGNLMIGKEAVVKANITAKNLTVEGRVDGKINVSDKVCLKANSAVKGDITSGRIVTEALCTLLGKCSIGGGSGAA